MRKLIVFGLIALLATSGLALAAPGHKGAPEFVPQLTEDQLTKVVFIRYAPEFQKDKLCDNDGVCDADERGWCDDCKGGEEPPEEPSGCYAFLAGAKPRWNWVEDYYYSNSLGTVSDWATGAWHGATSATIFGNGIHESYEWGVYDYSNAISYGDYPETGVIAVTAIWFRGKNIYEYDIMFDEEYFPDSKDLKTVALHEFGHAAGLGDLYDSVCVDEVMYWQYTVPKTTLGLGDETGIQTLYGA